MIRNDWRKMLDRAGFSQNRLADTVGYNRGIMSRICTGAQVMPMDDLIACTEILGCKPTDIYDDAAFQVLYPDVQPEVPKAKPSTVSIRIRKDVSDKLDRLVDSGIYDSRNEAVNGMLRGCLGEYGKAQT